MSARAPAPAVAPAETEARTLLGEAKTVVLKIGSSVLCNEPGTSKSVLHRVTLEQLADDIEGILARGRRVVVVSSGAVGLGMRELGVAQRPSDIATRQALAAVGQSSLMRAWREALRERGTVAGQVLLTHGDFADRKRYLAARRAMSALLELGVVPIVNENDTVADEELRFGDNDRLSAQVGTLIDADALVLLSTHDGLFTADPASDPDAAPVRYVGEWTDEVAAMVQDSTSAFGTGGMGSKLDAARAATHFGITTLIAAGREPRVVSRALAGERIGTVFLAAGNPLSARKHWIGYTLLPLGDVVVDDGAANALRARGGSLLPSGVVRVQGAFDMGDPVRIIGLDDVELGRGLSAYASEDIARIAGHHSELIQQVLGYHYGDEIVHRDDLVLF